MKSLAIRVPFLGALAWLVLAFPGIAAAQAADPDAIESAAAALTPSAGTAAKPAQTGAEIPVSSIEDAVRAAIESRIGGKIELHLSNPRIALTAPEGEGAVQVSNLNYEERSGRFTATVGTDPNHLGMVVTGRADPIVQVPVLKRAVAAGEIIGTADLDWQEMEAQRAANLVTDPNTLIGKAARRPLAPDRPLRSGDVQNPILVQKNALVSMTVQVPGMVLTAIGRALQDGGQGDTIQIMNPQSHRTVQGVVTGPNAAQVASRAQVLGTL